MVISFIIITLTALCMATMIDIRQRRIPNWLTLSLALIGLAHSLLLKGLTGLGEHILAMLFGLVVFFIFYLLQVFGAGDAKFMGALGAVMGWPFIVYATVLIIIVGGVISFIILWYQRGLREMTYILYSVLKALFTGRIKKVYEGNRGHSKHTFPFSIAITIGSVITLWHMYPHF